MAKDKVFTFSEPMALDENGYLYTQGQTKEPIPTTETGLHYEPQIVGRDWATRDKSKYPISNKMYFYAPGTVFYQQSDGSFRITPNTISYSNWVNGLGLNSQNNSANTSNSNGGNSTSNKTSLTSKEENKPPFYLRSERSQPTKRFNVVDADNVLLFKTEVPLYTGFGDQIANKEFKNVEDKYLTEAAAAQNCLKMTANWDANQVAPRLGVTPFRSLYSNYSPTRWQVPSTEDGKGPASIDSWEVAKYLEDSGKGTLVILPQDGTKIDYTKFPIGTFYFNGNNNRNKYLVNQTYKDEHGKVPPSHTYMQTGFAVDSDNYIEPVVADYGNITNNPDSHIYNKTPIYAFIPDDRKEFTADKVLKPYLRYKNGMETASLDGMFPTNISEAQSKALLEEGYPDAKTIQKIASYYDVPKEELFKRLMAIGMQESDLGNSTWYSFKEAHPNLVTAVKKASNITGVYPNSKSLEFWKEYDNTPGWKHEVDIYNQLQTEGKLEGLSNEQIRELINQRYNEEANKYPFTHYGVTKGKQSLINSRGIFQRKFDPYIDENYDKLKVGNGGEEIGRSFNKLALLYNKFKMQYPELTQEQLVDLATIAWNSGGKANNPDYVELAVRQGILQDSYLNKIKQHQSQIYKKGGGIHINPKNKGKFTETMKRTGKSAEELSHSKNPLTRKRAIFALNSRKWKHSDGGLIKKWFLGGGFQGLATDNGLMVSKDKNVSKSKPKIKLIKKNAKHN